MDALVGRALLALIGREFDFGSCKERWSWTLRALRHPGSRRGRFALVVPRDDVAPIEQVANCPHQTFERTRDGGHRARPRSQLGSVRPQAIGHLTDELTRTATTSSIIFERLFYTTHMCNRDGETDALTTLLAAVDAFREVAGSTPYTGAELADRLVRLRHCIDLLELAFAVDAAAFAETDEYDVQGSTSPIDWVRHNCHLSGNAAARAVNVGEQLCALPDSVNALQEGEIGVAHLQMLASNARALRDRVGLEVAAFDEGPLLKLALEHSVGKFAFDCTHARHVADAAAVLDEHVDAVERRRLDLTPCEGGMVAVNGYFDPVGGALLQTSLLPLAKPDGPDDPRLLPRRLADALLEVVQHSLDTGVMPSGASQRTHVVLTASVETVMGLEGAPGGDLEFGGVVPAATVQRLACDASIRRVLLGPDSVPIDVGRNLRVPAGATRDALRRRDGGCVWPDCIRPASMTIAHHLVHWAHGGATDLTNLVLLCHRHHWNVHEGGWRLVRTAGRRILTIPPTPTYRSWIRPPDAIDVS